MGKMKWKVKGTGVVGRAHNHQRKIENSTQGKGRVCDNYFFRLQTKNFVAACRRPHFVWHKIPWTTFNRGGCQSLQKRMPNKTV